MLWDPAGCCYACYLCFLSIWAPRVCLEGDSSWNALLRDCLPKLKLVSAGVWGVCWSWVYFARVLVADDYGMLCEVSTGSGSWCGTACVKGPSSAGLYRLYG